MLRAALFATAALAATGTAALAIELPNGFVVEDAVPSANFVVPVAIAFFPAADGRMLVAEKEGRVWVVKNGVKRPTPLWQGQNEVLDDGDRGMLGVAIDPDYAINHYVYFLYTVDPDSNGNDNNNEDAWGRLVRYRTSAADSNVVDPASRTVLMGTNWRDGPIIGSPSHTIGALRWGADQSLLITAGDGAQYSDVDDGGLDAAMFGPLKADPYLDIGAYRAQYIGCLNGKLLRINRFTGQGFPSNPFWNGDSGAARSKVWAYGLRNPFRFSVKPGTGNADSTAGDPGTLYIGDVGWANWEEIDIARVGGKNFGWPCYEGLGEQFGYQNAAPSHGGCDSIGVSPWNPNPVTQPTATWHHSTDDIGTPPGFHGNTAIAGVFYTGTGYPGLYQNRYFFGDYGGSWIKVLVTDSNDNLVSVLPFATDTEGAVDFAIDPSSGDVHYVSIFSFEVRRIRFTGTTGGNQAPVAVAAAVPLSGPPPLEVTFTGDGSYDLDNDPLAYQWTFGDGFGSTDPNPIHTYNANGSYSAVLTVTDGQGGLDRDTVLIHVAAAVGFPSASVLDNFNRPNGPIGLNWTGQTTGLSINSNSLIHSGGYASVVWNGAGGVFGPVQEAYFKLLAVTPSSPEHDVLLKVQGTTTANAHIEVRYDALEGAVRVATYTPGIGWEPRGGPYPVTLVPGDVYGARAFDNGHVDVFVNGVNLGTADCSGWGFANAGGRIGMGYDNATSSRMDDFGGGNVVINGPPTATILWPPDSTFYISGDIVTFSGAKSDDINPADSLAGHWSLRLIHNNHFHVEGEVDADTVSRIMSDHDDGTGVHYLGRYIVTDKGGLKDTATVEIFPEVDLHPIALNVVPDAPRTTLETLVEFFIANHGRLQSPRSHWRLIANTTVLAEGDTVLAARDTIRIARILPAGTLGAGNYVLRVAVDTLGTVVETNETNNALAKTITVLGPATDVEGSRRLALSAAYPNPTRGGAQFSLDLPQAAMVEFEVIDVQGRSVWSTGSRLFAAGQARLFWDGRTRGGRRAPPGLYLARVQLGASPAMVRRFVVLE